MINNIKLEIILLFFIYLAANIFLLLNFNAIYWDDWAWFYQDDMSFVLQAFDQLKLGYRGDFFIFLMNFNFFGGHSFRIFVFFGIFVSGLSLYYILSKIELFDKHDRFYLVLFFLLAPLFSLKMLPSIATFYLPVMFFFLGFSILVKYVNTKNIIYRFLALMLFLLSFSTHSVLVLYFIIFIFLYNFHFKKFIGIKEVIKNIFYIIKKYIDFFIIPFLYYIYKSIYMIPWGDYEGYNRISLMKMLNPNNYIRNINDNFSEPIFSSIQILSPILPVIILLIFIANLLIKNRCKNEFNQDNKRYLILFFIGVIIFILGAMPYLAVGKIPTMYETNTRFQLLLPLGFSIMLYCVVMLIFTDKVKKYILIILCLSFILFHAKDQLYWNIDWQYQQSIQENFKNSEVVKNNSTFLVVNNLGNKLNYNRDQIFYELNGISKKAFGDDKRFFVNNLKQIDLYKKYKKYKHYNFSSWIESEPITIYFIDTLEKNAGGRIDKLKFFIKLKYLELFNKEKHKQEVLKLVEIR